MTSDIFNLNDIVVLKTESDPRHWIGVVTEGRVGQTNVVQVALWDWTQTKWYRELVYDARCLTVIGSLADMGITEVGW
jgi:hypothetical protein